MVLSRNKKRDRGAPGRGMGWSLRAFTLIEMIVVITILVLLISILLPALSYAKKVSNKTSTTAEMQSLRSGCEQYFQTFQAYPGLFAENDVAASAGTTNSISGTQNLYLSLMGAVITASPGSPPGSWPGQLVTLPAVSSTSAYLQQVTETGTAITVKGYSGNNINSYYVTGIMTGSGVTVVNGVASGGIVSAYVPAGPNDLTLVGNGANARQFAPFYQVRNGESAMIAGPTYGVSSGTFGTAGYTPGIPAFIDHYPDGLPILYYRRTPGVDSPAATEKPTATSAAAFYRLCNAAYTDSATLTSTSGSPISQTTGSTVAPLSISGADCDGTLAAMAGACNLYVSGSTYNAGARVGSSAGSSPAGYLYECSSASNTNAPSGGANGNGWSTVANPAGSFILVSAGASRLYGSTDNIVVVGGQ